MHSVLEEHDETKNKENKKGEPKESAYQRHGENANVGDLPGQRWTSGSLPAEIANRLAACPPSQASWLTSSEVNWKSIFLERLDETAMLFAPCASRWST